jgi:cytochrome c biogenesis protein
MNPKRLLLSRVTAVTLIASITFLMVVASVVPQAFMTPPAELAAWRAAHPALAAGVSALGLDHLYGSPLFAVPLLLALAALLTSGAEQLRVAVRRSRGRGGITGGAILETRLPPEDVSRILRSRGYLPVRDEGGERVLVRHPWGHWGNVLLHVGLATVVASSAVIGLTQQRGAVHIVEGATFPSGGPWFSEENGIAARPLVLPFAVRLDHLDLGFWPTYGLRSAVSTLTLIHPGRPPVPLKVGINDIQDVDGITVYQGVEVGHAFRVEVTEGERSRALDLLIPHAGTPHDPGSNEFRDVIPGGSIRARYWVDADRRSFQDFNPVLILNVYGPGGYVGDATLRPGIAAEVGPYRIRLEKVTLWTRLFFVRITGIWGVFAGFAVIALGGALHYFTPPREALLQGTPDGGTRVAWRAARFHDFYADELDEIRIALQTGGARG